MSKGPRIHRGWADVGLQGSQTLGDRGVGGGVQDQLRRSLTRQPAANVTRVPGLTGERGQVSLGDVDPGETVTTSWEVPGRSGPVTVLLTLEVYSESGSGAAALTVESATWPPFDFTSGSRRALTAMFQTTAGASVDIAVTNDPASTGILAAGLTYSTLG